jgi:hypothetical protein
MWLSTNQFSFVRWGHIHKSTLKFAERYNWLERINCLAWSWQISFLMPKKAYYEQEGKQFIFEPAWKIVKNLAKWTTKHSGDTRDSQSQDLPSGATPTNTANCAKDGTSTPGNTGTGN